MIGDTAIAIVKSFETLILMLAAYRLQRIVTRDHWPPSLRLRRWLKNRADRAATTRAVRDPVDGEEYPVGFWPATYRLLTCPWCLGFWVSSAIVVEHYVFSLIPILVYIVLATSTVVGLIASWDE